MVLVGRSEGIRSSAEAGERWLDDADRLVAAVPDSPVRYRALLARAGLRLAWGRDAEVEPLVAPHLGDIQGLGAPDLLARALDLIGSARAGMGDADGLEYLRRAVDIAREGRAVFELQVALNNLGASLVKLGRLSEIRAVLKLRQESFDTFGGSLETRQYYSLSVAQLDFYEGRWDAALQRVEELLPVWSAARLIREVDARLLRMHVVAMRDPRVDPRPAIAQALAKAQAADESGAARVASLPDAAELLALCGYLDEASALWEEARVAIVAGGHQIVDEMAMCFGWAAVLLGRQADGIDAAPHLGPGPWPAAAEALMRGEFARVAADFTEMGCPLEAAKAALFAGEQRRAEALDFFRSLGAVRYLALADAELPPATGAAE